MRKTSKDLSYSSKYKNTCQVAKVHSSVIYDQRPVAFLHQLTHTSLCCMLLMFPPMALCMPWCPVHNEYPPCSWTFMQNGTHEKIICLNFNLTKRLICQFNSFKIMDLRIYDKEKDKYKWRRKIICIAWDISWWRHNYGVPVPLYLRDSNSDMEKIMLTSPPLT